MTTRPLSLGGGRSSPATPTLFGAIDTPLPSPAAAVDQRVMMPAPWNQASDEGCVGFGLVGGLYLAVGCKGRPASPHGLWTAARARERLRVGDVLTNEGVDPIDAIEAAVSTGVYPWDSIDDAPDGPGENETETLVEAEAAKIVPVESFSSIDDGDLDTVLRWLTLGAQNSASGTGIGVTFAMQVDQSFMDVADGSVWQGPTGPYLGGHEQVTLGFDATSVLVRGSWSADWADGGYVRIARSWFQKNATNLVAVCQGVVL